MNIWPQQKLPRFGFRTQIIALCPMEQSSILSVKFDCPVARQNFLLFATVHDCDTSLLLVPASMASLFESPGIGRKLPKLGTVQIQTATKQNQLVKCQLAVILTRELLF